jgi:UDP-glucose 4-epimerase
MIPKRRGSGAALVTGAAGFLGGAVSRALRKAGWRVAGLDFLPGGKGFDHWTTGEADRAALARAAEAIGAPEIVFHAAGGASVGASLADPKTDHARTVGSLMEMLAFLKDHAPSARLIYPSSAAVYGAASAKPLAENYTLEPISPYALNKLHAEAEIIAASTEFGLEAVILRFFSLYGPGLRKQLLWDLAQRLTSGPSRLELSGSGEEQRDFLYIDDAVQLVGLAARVRLSGAPRTWNGGRGEAITVRQAAETLARAMGKDVAIDFSGETRAGDPTALVADVTAARKLGFEPRTSFEDGVQAFADWFAAVPA